jgi:threonine/homoserine/homoserine lactone efflux protein
MHEEYQDEHRKKAAQMRSIMDFTMGGLLIIFGIYFLVYSRLGINFFNRKPSAIDYFLGALFLIYGIWRIYRGYKKNYY